MRGLLNFVKDIKLAPSKEIEDARIQSELHKIREKFAQKNLSGYDRKKYVWKLIYIYMLGHNIEFGHMEAIVLVSSASYHEKKAGYIACSLMLLDQPEILSLITNILKKDLSNHAQEPYVTALALNAIANIGSAEYAQNLFSDIARLAGDTSAVDFVRRRAYIAMLRLFRREPKIVSLPSFVPRIIQAWEQESEIGVLISLAAFMVGVLEGGNIQAWQGIYEPVVECLHRVLSVGGQVAVFLYYRVPCPWLLVKLLRILQFFPPPQDASLKEKLHGCLTTALNAAYLVASDGPTAVRGFEETKVKNRVNSELMVAFEACSLICHLGHLHVPKALSQLMGQRLIQALEHKDVNIRYLALDVIARLTPAHLNFTGLKEVQATFTLACKDHDGSIRRMARNVIFAFCDENNWKSVVDDFLDQLRNTNENEVQEELSLKIAVLVEKYALDFKTYVDVLFKTFEFAPHAVSPDVGFRFIQILVGFDAPKNTNRGQSANARAGDSELQRHAARKALEILETGSSLYKNFQTGNLTRPNNSDGSHLHSPHRLAALLGNESSQAGNTAAASTGAIIKPATTVGLEVHAVLEGCYVPDELFSVAAYILGELGHTNAEEVGVGRQLTALTKHRHLLTKPSALGIMIFAVAKSASGYLATLQQNGKSTKADMLLDRVLGLLEEYHRHSDPEVQQRSIELHALLSTATTASNSQALASVQHALGLMPPFAASIQANNPLLSRMKDLQASRRRAVDRTNLELLAQTEGRTIKTGGGNGSGNAFMSLNPDKVKKNASNGVVGGRRAPNLRSDAPTSADSIASSRKETQHDDEDDEEDEEEIQQDRRLNEPSRSVNKKSESDDDEDDDESEEDEDEELPFTLPSARSATDVENLWKILCILPKSIASSPDTAKQRLLYAAGPLQITLLQDYRQAIGRIRIEFSNTHQQHPIAISSIQIVPPPNSNSLEIRSKSPPTSVAPNSKIYHDLEVTCKAPFVTSPKYIVTLGAAPGVGLQQSTQLPFSLPIVASKFLNPAEISPDVFVKYWADLGNNPAKPGSGEVKIQAPSSLIAPPLAGNPAAVSQAVSTLRQEISGYLSSAFNFALISSVTAPTSSSPLGLAICGAATLCTTTPNPAQPNKPLTVACMIKIDIDPRSGSLCQVACRAAHPMVADVMAKLVSSFILQQTQQPQTVMKN